MKWRFWIEEAQHQYRYQCVDMVLKLSCDQLRVERHKLNMMSANECARNNQEYLAESFEVGRLREKAKQRHEITGNRNEHRQQQHSKARTSICREGEKDRQKIG